VQYRELPLLFRNLGKRRFENVPAFRTPMVARGAAYADFDHDGDLDILLSTNHGPAYLYRNDGGNRNSWIAVRPVGTKSNRDGIGAVVRVQSASGRQWQMVRSGSSYCSQSDLTLTFGLGQDKAVEVEVEWPGGSRQAVGSVDICRVLTIVEGEERQIKNQKPKGKTQK
jgi:hypothetical protein